MTFQHPEYLIPLLAFFLLLGLTAPGRRQRVTMASRELARPAGALSRAAAGVPLLCWFLLSGFLVAALADPMTARVQSSLKVHAKEAMVSVDASASMGEGEGGSTMDRIRLMLRDFAERRIGKGDFLGISAYGGPTNSSRGYGYARVIQYPTRDLDVARAAIDALQPSMFGHYSAVGDGILVSILALIEPGARRALGSRYEPERLEGDLWSIGAEEESLGSAIEIAEAIGEQRGRYIVLFTDGKFNTGLHPAAALWYAERIGLRVHFISFESSAATGLSPEEQRRRKAMTVGAVLRTGGMYRESTDVEGVAAILDEIDGAEKADIEVEDKSMLQSLRGFLVAGIALTYAIWALGWFAWSDPL